MYRVKLLSFVFFLIFSIVFTGCKKKEAEKPSSGTIENGTYSNKYFGLTLQFPEDWDIKDEESSKQLRDMGSKFFAGGDENIERTLNASAEERQLWFFSASKYPVGTPVANNPSIISMAEFIGDNTGIKNGNDYLFHVKKALEISGINYSTAEVVTTEEIGGKEFYLLKVTLPFGNISVEQKYYSAIVKDYAISFILTYLSENGENSLKEVLKTAKFE
jgi:hypothetical protein